MGERMGPSSACLAGVEFFFSSFFFQAVSKLCSDEVAFQARDISALAKPLNYVNMVIEKKNTW